MLGMVPYHRPKSGHITCYLNRTYHVLLTLALLALTCFRAWPNMCGHERLPVDD
jgi:hypothetical protein